MSQTIPGKTPEQIDKDYLNNPGHCPFCGSGEVDYTSPDGTKTESWVNVECIPCGAEWTEVLNLVGITNLKPPIKPETEDESESEENPDRLQTGTGDEPAW